MERLLTTKDLQEILQLDRITVYRMLEAGELPGMKIGGQWRFAEQEVKNWLERAKTKRTVGDVAAWPVPGLALDLPSEESLRQSLKLTDMVSTVCLQNVQDGFADAVGVASLVVDLQGTPLTTLTNASDFCRLGRTSREFRARCSQSWSSLADATEAQPEVHLCHAMIGYAIAPVQVHGKKIGLVVAGQFWSDPPEPEHVKEVAARLSAEYALPLPVLLQTLETVPVISQERVFLITRLLATIAATLSEIGFQAYEMRLKLQQIVQIVKTAG